MQENNHSTEEGPLDSRELLRRAQKLFAEDQVQKSIDLFTLSIDAGENSEIVFLSRGVAYIKTEQLDRAINDFSIVIDMNRQNYRAYMYRGTARLRKEDFRNAISDFERTIELKPDYGAAFFARGTAYAHIGNGYEATKDIKTAISFSGTLTHGFGDDGGMFKPELSKAMAWMSGKGVPAIILLTDKEVVTLNKWLQQQDESCCREA